MRVTVLGAGAWGTALAKVLTEGGSETTLWTWLDEHARAMQEARENREFLPGVELPRQLKFTCDLNQAVQGAVIVFVVVPSHAVRATLQKAKASLDADVQLVCASKGIEEGTLNLMTEVMESVVAGAKGSPVAVLSGPSFAKEVARKVPTNLVAASLSEELSLSLQQLLSNDWLRVYTSADPTGVEVGGALKNVIAIAAGACDGLGFGKNTQAALMTRGIAEMGRLTMALGGDFRTVAGLAGVGDLILTCTGEMSRNRTLGYKLGQGAELEQALSTSDGVSEGYLTAKSAYLLSQKLGVDLPICQAVYSVLHEGTGIQGALRTLLSRPLGTE